MTPRNKLATATLCVALAISAPLATLAASSAWNGPYLSPGQTYYTSGDCTYVGSNGGIFDSGVPCSGGYAGSVSVGNTAVKNATNGDSLYNNNGILGQRAVTGSGSAVLATSPTLTTPTITNALGISGTAPTPTGTGTPTIATGSTDTAGEVTAGASATSVVITFAGTYVHAPFCTVTDQSQLTSFAYAITNTAITVTQTATTGNKIDYICAFTG